MAEEHAGGGQIGASIEEIRRILPVLGVELDEADAADLGRWVESSMALARSLAGLRDVERAPAPAREWRWATRERDPLNAFVTFCDVPPAGDGTLAGLRVAVKDCIALAGVPQTDGGGRVPYPVPSTDAVAVERVLLGGARIVGKTNMEDLAVGTGVGSFFGPSKNPRNPEFITGGSSGGSAAAVGSTMADIGLGTDQAGSVRIPAAWCGLVGMKATHGLVPTQGIRRMDPTLDHLGPITRDVRTNALALDCLAGPDWRDRSTWGVPCAERPARSAAPVPCHEMRIGVVRQAVESLTVSEGVRGCCDGALGALERLGARVDLVDVPLWGAALPIFTAVVSHGMFGTWTGRGIAYGTVERIDLGAAHPFPSGRRLGSGEIHPRVLTRLVMAWQLAMEEGGTTVGRAQNLRLSLGRQIDDALRSFDVLVTPTVEVEAVPVPAAGKATRAETMQPSRELANTCPLDLSGHPALTVPCGAGAHGLPVGMQLIGRWHDERTLYRYGLAIEEVLA